MTAQISLSIEPRHLQLALQEHDLRQRVTKNKIESLSILCESKCRGIDKAYLFKMMLKNIERDIEYQQKLNSIIDNEPYCFSFPLRYNKNLELFQSSKNILLQQESKVDDIIAGKCQSLFPLIVNEKTIFPNHDLFNQKQYDYNVFGSKKLTQCHYLMTTALRSLNYEEDIWRESYNLDDQLGNPLIQGVTLPQTLLANIGTKLKGWFFFDEVKNELLIPTSGYAFGGSRKDYQYHDKHIKNEDCSSSVLKWLKCPRDDFSTSSFALLHDLYFHDQNNSDFKSVDYLLNYMKPKNVDSFADIAIGDIVVILKNGKTGGHVGIVSDLRENNSYEYISYNRELSYSYMEEDRGFEGIGFSTMKFFDLENSTYKELFFTAYS